MLPAGIGSLSLRYLFIGMFAASVAGCAQMPRSAYDFDDGTTQGWKVTAVRDDTGKVYTPIFPVQHAEAAQYPGSFPMGDPLKDKKGSLLINPGQMSGWVSVSGFPSASEYWETTAYYTGLTAYGSAIWQGIKGVAVSVGDDLGTAPGHIFANVGVSTDTGGKHVEIAELDSSGKPLFRPVAHDKWSRISAKLNVPQNASVYKVWVKIRGDWKNYKLYEGQLMIDQVEPVK